MLLLAAALLLAPGTSGATGASSGPDVVDKAVPVALPIDEVMVFSDRARVTRRGAVKLVGGPQVLRAPDLPGAVMLDSVRVSATGTKVVRVETRPVERERWSIDQVDGWIAELERLGDDIALVQGKKDAAENELNLLAGLTVALPIPEKDRLGKVIAPSPAAWKEAQDVLARRRARARDRQDAAEVELRALTAKYERAQREVQQRNIGAFSDQKLEVVVIVDGGAGNGTVAVEYAIGGAFWKPSYDLFFDPDSKNVELKASGNVTQATGEDWPAVKLALSTAVPGQGIDMPKLRTWTLGDDREYVPTPSARITPRTTRPFQPPAAQPRFAELAAQADRELLNERTQQLLTLASSPPPRSATTSSGLMGGIGASSGRAMPRPRAMAAPAAAYDGTDSEGAYVEEDEMPEAVNEAYAESAPMADMPMASMAAPAPVTMSKSAERRRDGPRARGLRLVNGIGWQRPTFADALLPAVSAGGLDYVYTAPVAVTVPAQANNQRVPLASRTYPVQTFYEATPSLATTAYLKATVKNGSALPILAGPANVFVKRTFSGDAQLMTTGPGGVLELPLGADEDIRLTRTVVPATTTKGVLFGEEDVTDYAVKIEVGNYKKQAVTVRVIDQVPLTNAEKIKVELLSSSPKSVASEDGDGLLYWHVDVPAGGVKAVTFTYRITRPKNWKLSQ